MTISPSRQFLVVVAATFHLCVLTFAQPQHKKDNDAKFSGDFQNFLKDMESIVFKEKNNAKEMFDTIKRVPQYTTSNPYTKKHTNILRTQKAAIRDVLMMKLVSYYEEKYKVARHETSTATVTFRPSSRAPVKSGIRRVAPPQRSEFANNDIDVDPSAEVVVL